MRLVLAAAAALALATASSPVQYNVEWTTASKEPGTTQGGLPTYQGSMPIGNGKLTAQTWANVSAGGIGLYVGHQVWWTHAYSILLWLRPRTGQ